MFTTTDSVSRLEGGNAQRLPAWDWANTSESSNSASAAPGISRSSVLLTALWLFIGLVAAYDVYLSIKYQETLQFQELNPVGRWLLEIDNGSIATFMGCKFLGTMITLGVIQVLYAYKRNMGLTVATALAGVQALLAAYLTFG
ncbi:MAG TPA: hypothetical protein VL096_21010 [Pirellulaceae bacterium]|nr:hypothetical protein [Pirellulaceae bacterium]